jgi:hypothetical protein
VQFGGIWQPYTRQAVATAVQRKASGFGDQVRRCGKLPDVSADTAVAIYTVNTLIVVFGSHIGVRQEPASVT